MYRHIGLLFGKRLDTIFYVIGFEISGFIVHKLSDSLRIFFSTLEGEFVAEFTRCMWTEGIYGKIQNYPDTDACGWGIRERLIITTWEGSLTRSYVSVSNLLVCKNVLRERYISVLLSLCTSVDSFKFLLLS